MNDASMWRIALARQVLAPYVPNPNLRAMLLGGSVGYGIADRYADIDIWVYWEQPPTDAERRVVIEQAGAVVAAFDAYDPAAQQGRDVYFVSGDAASGILFDVTHQPVAAMEQLLADVLERHDATYVTQREIAGMQHAVVLHGAGLVDGWRRRAAAYPDQLALATVQRFLTFGPHWMVEQAAARHDSIFLRNLCWEAIYRVLPVLMALNRIYYPSHKHLHRLLAGPAIAPPELWPRVLQVLRADERDSADTLRALIADTFMLVETHLPALDTHEARRRWQLPATAAVGGEKLRRAVLRRVAAAYRAAGDVRALLLTGSVAQRHADRYSDLDLLVVWDALPPIDVRLDVLRRGDSTAHELVHPNADLHAAEDCWLVDGVRLDVQHWSVHQIDALLGDVLEHADTELAKQRVAAGLHEARAIHGAELLRHWQARLGHYPPALAEAMVREHLDFGPHWRWQALAERGDVLFLNAWMLGDVSRLAAVLAAMNGTYHPANMWANWFARVKHFDQFAGRLLIAPENFAARCRQVLTVETPAARAVLYALIEETFELVDIHVPTIDTSDARAEFRYRRAGWDAAPAGLQ